MNRPSMYIAALLLTIAATTGASAQTAAATRPVAPGSVATAANTTASAPAPRHKKAERSDLAPGVAGATGGSYDASSRTSGGPPPELKTGITFPIPSIGDSNKK